MKNKNKTIVEANKGSMTKKIGRYAVIVALYIAIVTTLAFIMSTITLIVNADSSGGGVLWSNPYSYTSMDIYTDNGTYCVGSNDYFTNPSSSENNISFDDYYSILIEQDDEEMYFYVKDNSNNMQWQFALPENNISFRSLISTYGTLSNTTYVYWDVDNNSSLYCSSYDISNGSIFYFNRPIGGGQSLDNVSLDTIITNNDVFTFTYYGGGNDVPETEQPGTDNEFWRPTDQPGAYSLNSRAVADSPISIKRLNNATYNSSGNYYSIFSEITSPNIIGFEFHFTKDLAVTYAQLTNNEFYYNYSMTQDFSITKVYTLLYYDIDGNLQSQEITSIISYDAGDTGTLLPTLHEIEFNIGQDTMGSQDIYLIQDLYVSTNSSIEVGTDYVHIFEWIAYNYTKTKQISNDYVNNFYKTTKIDMGEILLNSVNSFLKFELIPGFSLLSLLALVIGIPLLIYILKLFLGG